MPPIEDAPGFHVPGQALQQLLLWLSTLFSLHFPSFNACVTMSFMRQSHSSSLIFQVLCFQLRESHHSASGWYYLLHCLNFRQEKNQYFPYVICVQKENFYLKLYSWYCIEIKHDMIVWKDWDCCRLWSHEVCWVGTAVHLCRACAFS